MAVSDINVPDAPTGPELGKMVENAVKDAAQKAESAVAGGYTGGDASNPEFRAFSGIVTYLLDEMERQPWWRKYSNTATAMVSGLVVLAGWILTTGVGLPHWATITIGVILFVGSVLGIHATPDGLTEPILARILNMPNSPLKPAGQPEP